MTARQSHGIEDRNTQERRSKLRVFFIPRMRYEIFWNPLAVSWN
jgi:hypothetical protein